MSDADLKSPRRWTRRPLFAPSQMLTARQLNALVDDQRAHSEMLMRGLHGHGVIFGLAVTLGDRRRGHGEAGKGETEASGGAAALAITCGMALDRHGRLLQWPGGRLAYGEIANRPDCPGSYTLSVHHAQRKLSKGGCGPCGDEPEWIEEGVVFTLSEGCQPADRGCRPPKDGCVGLDDYICFATGSAAGAIPPSPDLDHACDAPGALCRIECSDTYYDPAAGIAIACVTMVDLAVPDCPSEWGFGTVASGCEIRPRVYRTPLLYELIRGCQNNLARVGSLSWQDWCVGFGTVDWDHRVPWDEFAKKFGEPDELIVTFTKPILSSSVHRGSVFFTVIGWEKEADYVVTRRIPANPEPVEPGKYADRFKIQINPKWIRNEIATRSNLRSGGRIELTIRGQLLRDQCGNMLDAVPLGYAPESPALSRPGGDFTTIFRFAKASQPPQPQEEESEDEA